MHYPLAHDEEGLALEVPGTATGWLVRRHAGGKGRPAAVYDGDGTPLVVALDATADQLRDAGCRPGMYRLDAVDAQRRLMGVAAYTEIVHDSEATDAVPKSGSDAAVMALARAVEAMQRVQAERERVQAEMFAKLIDRLGPPPAAPQAPDLRNSISEAVEVKKTLDGLAAAEAAQTGAEAEEEEAEPETRNPFERLILTIAPLVDVIMATLKAGKASPRNTAPAPAEEAAGEAAGEVDEHATAEFSEKLEAVLSRLTKEEIDQAETMMKAMPPHVFEMAKQELMTLSTDEAVVRLRTLMQAFGGRVKEGGNGARS
jgi:hypothetical protein